MKGSFKDLKMNENNPKWEKACMRINDIYKRPNEVRSDFERDYNRIINSNAYKRLKHKTQVFFSPHNDHICTGIEHVTHVESISYTIANYLGLNTELTKAIATGHDMGHSPFGHKGEKILSEIMERDVGETFWHEKNGLNLADNIELLEDNLRNEQNMNLCYAVRDGIISHCGEIDENFLKPREEDIDLSLYKMPGEYNPYTWEACVVKIADKIAYLGRDIEDAVRLRMLDDHLDELYEILNYNSEEKINNTTIINNLISDLCMNSSPENGLCFSEDAFNMINKIKEFNYKNIYFADRLNVSTEYFRLVINTMYYIFRKCYDQDGSLKNMNKMISIYPRVITNFRNWLANYWNLERKDYNKNKVIFDVTNLNEFSKAIIIYIAGMTYNFAIDAYNNIINFL